MPYRKERCSVLCRKRCIPNMEPTLPPIMASTKRVDSGMRHARFLARALSTPIAVKLIKLIAARYTIIKVIAFIKHTIDSQEKQMPLSALLVFLLRLLHYNSFSPFSCIFIARTLHDKPNRLIKPSASWWSYRSPVVKEAMLSL